MTKSIEDMMTFGLSVGLTEEEMHVIVESIKHYTRLFNAMLTAACAAHEKLDEHDKIGKAILPACMGYMKNHLDDLLIDPDVASRVFVIFVRDEVEYYTGAKKRPGDK